MVDEMDDLFGSEEEQQDDQQEPVFDEGALEDEMDDVPVQNEVSSLRFHCDTAHISKAACTSISAIG